VTLAVAQLPSPEKLPPGLLVLSNWLSWRSTKRDGQLTKVPWSPITGKRASTTDPKTWATFDQAAAFADREHCDGIGFVFTDTPYVGIDLDHCVDPTGAVARWAFEIVARFGSYTEFSPSGTGLHIFVEGSLPEGGRKRKVIADNAHDLAAIEVYETGRYFIRRVRSLIAAPN
jgi:putative DNA primase/helicase